MLLNLWAYTQSHNTQLHISSDNYHSMVKNTTNVELKCYEVQELYRCQPSQIYM